MTRTEQQQWQKHREGIMERLMERCCGVHQLGRDYCRLTIEEMQRYAYSLCYELDDAVVIVISHYGDAQLVNL